MAEDKVETNEKVSEEQRAQARQAWEAHYASQGKTLESLPYNEKQSVLHIIANGVGPEAWQAIPQEAKSKEERGREAEKIRQKVDIAIDKYMRVKEERDKQEEKKPPPYSLGGRVKVFDKDGENVREDWRSLNGWERGDLEQVKGRLQELFGMNNSQIETTLELLLTSKRTKAEILAGLTKDRLDEITKEIRSGVGQRRVDYPELRFFRELGINEQYVMRFVFADDFAEEITDQYERTPPNNIEELAWQMSWNAKAPEIWGIRGSNPLLELRKKINNKTGEDEYDYCVNETNMIKWLRYKMMNAHGFDPDAAHNFFTEVELKKNFASPNAQEMMLNPSQYFRSKDGRDYGKLADQFVIETWGLTTLRSWDVEYRGAMSEAKLIETVSKIFKGNTLTKRSFNTNLLTLMTTLPLDFKEKSVDGSYHSDNKVGAAWIQSHLIYDNISDYEGLQGVLGVDSEFFTRDGFIKALAGGLEKRKANTGGKDMTAIIGRKQTENFAKAFDEKTGEVKNKKAFVELVNIFDIQTPNELWEEAVRQMLRNAIKEKLGIGSESGGDTDNNSVDMAELIAWSMSRFSGTAANADTTAVGYDYNTRMFLTQSYRKKMATPRRGDFFGNPFSVFAFKRLNVDLFRGIKTETYSEKIGPDGKPMPVYKTPLDVMRELHRMKRTQEAYLKGLADVSENERENIRAALDQEYQNKANELIFQQKTLEHYSDNHLGRGYKLYDILMKSEELNLDQFTHFDLIRGITFDRAKFQDAVQQKFLKQLRYNFSTYGELDYGKVDRYLDQAATDKFGEPVYREMTLGESMFGYEMLNRREFWKAKLNERGKAEWVYDDWGRHVIDYERVQENKTVLWKQWALMKIGAELHAHMSLHTTDPAFNYSYYLNVLQAIENIPGFIEGDEYGMTDTRTPKNRFFSKEDISWLRKTAKLRERDLAWRWILSDMFTSKDDKGQGYGEAFGLFIKAIAPS